MLPWLILTALVLSPAVALVAVLKFKSETPSELTDKAGPVLMVADPVAQEGQQDAKLRIELGEEPILRSPSGDGIITRSYLKPGETLVDGDPVIAVDQVIKPLFVASQPLYRSLGSRSRGADVKAVQAFLKRQGYLETEPDGVYGPATTAAVKVLERRLGVSIPTGSFTPSLVVWTPDSSFTVLKSAASLGAAAPAAGGELATGRPIVTRATLVRDGGGPVVSSDDLVLTVAGTKIGVVPAGAKEVPADLATKVLDSLTTRPDPQELKAGIPVTLTRETPTAGVTVPAAAVMTNRDGTAYCVWLTHGASYTASKVDVAGGELGTSTVTGIAEGAHVLTNPIDTLAQPLCP